MKFDPDTGKPISLDEQVQRELMSFYARASLALMIMDTKTTEGKEKLTEHLFEMAMVDGRDIIEIVSESMLRAKVSLRD